MTGQHMGHTHVRGNAGGDMARQSLRDIDLTVAEKMKEEARETIEENFKVYSNWMKDELKLEAELVIREGEKATEVLNQIQEDKEVGVLVLGANNSSEGPGPLISQLVSRDGGNLPIPVTIVPGSMTKERIEAVS